MNLIDLFVKNGFIVALAVTGIVLWISSWISLRFTNKKIPGTAIAIFSGLLLAWYGGEMSDGKAGISDIPFFSGFALLGGAMFRDFTIVSTAMGARFSEMKKAGLMGLVALILGVTLAFTFGALLAMAMGYHDSVSITTIGAGACTFIVGPITGGAIGAPSEIIALSIAAGVIKSIAVTIGTPWVAKFIGLNNPQTAMVYGGLIGTTSGVAAGLAATDPRLVPYGAITATFYTGLGCLLCPSVFYLLVQWLNG
jgi:malonate transporter MadM subunit